MIKFWKDFKLFLAWRNTPYHQFAEIHELCMLAARRCAHDLDHASGEILYTTGTKKESSEYFHEKAQHSRNIFYPIENQKNYRHDLHRKIYELESQNKNLCNILREHNIPIEKWSKYENDIGL